MCAIWLKGELKAINPYYKLSIGPEGGTQVEMGLGSGRWWRLELFVSMFQVSDMTIFIYKYICMILNTKITFQAEVVGSNWGTQLLSLFFN